MDVSLDDYISKSNFRVQVGNPGFNKNKNAPFQGRKFSAPGGADGGFAAPGVPKPVKIQFNNTNQVRDARERLNQTKPVDARDKLIQKQKSQNTDARQKLMNIRARKTTGPQAAAPGPMDARAKIEAKKQQKSGPFQQVGAPGGGGLTLTRTVNNNPVQISARAGGNVQITRTLSTVMPPGYEDIQGESPKLQITRRLGGPPSSGQNNSARQQAPTITRTIPGSFRPQSGSRAAAPSQYQNTGYQQAPKQNPPRSFNIPPPPHGSGQHVNTQFSAPPPPQTRFTSQPPPRHGPPYPTEQTHYTNPPPGHASQGYPPQQYHTPPPDQYEGPPPHMQQPPQPPPQHYRAPPPHSVSTSPPYPVEDRHIVRTVGAQIGQNVPQNNQTRGSLPLVHVHNDHYNQPPPQQYGTAYPSSPEPLYHAQPPYPSSPDSYQYSQPNTQTHGYQVDRQPLTLHRSVPNEGSSYKKTFVNRPAEVQSVKEPLKRKLPSGPLKLSHTNTVPVIESPYPAPQPRLATSRQLKDEPPIKRVKDEESTDDIISPIQGFKIAVTNLHATVTQDDIIELFGAVGPMKQVRMSKPGIADISYVKREHANQASETYHNRELDGLPMQVKVVTPATARFQKPPETLPPSAKALAGEPLKLYKKPAGMSKLPTKDSVDVGTLHKALFKTGGPTPTKPVTFTVKI